MQVSALFLPSPGVPAIVRTFAGDALPSNPLLLEVHASAINYKDALIVTGRGYPSAAYPLVPGIDFAGVVVTSADPSVPPGTRVAVVNAMGFGDRHWGGLATHAAVLAEAVTVLPEGVPYRHAMILGTAGLAAGLSANAIERHGVKPGDGPVLVTGAGGAVGTVAVALLARAGYEVVASTGRAMADTLRAIGAHAVIGRLGEDAPTDERWAAVVDVVGGPTLERAIAGVKGDAIVAANGFAGSASVTLPLVAMMRRAVTISAIGTSRVAPELRQRVWDRLLDVAHTLDRDDLVETVSLNEAPSAAEDLLHGRRRARVLVRP